MREMRSVADSKPTACLNFTLDSSDCLRPVPVPPEGFAGVSGNSSSSTAAGAAASVVGGSMPVREAFFCRVSFSESRREASLSLSLLSTTSTSSFACRTVCRRSLSSALSFFSSARTFERLEKEASRRLMEVKDLSIRSFFRTNSRSFSASRLSLTSSAVDSRDLASSSLMRPRPTTNASAAFFMVGSSRVERRWPALLVVEGLVIELVTRNLFEPAAGKMLSIEGLLWKPCFSKLFWMVFQ